MSKVNMFANMPERFTHKNLRIFIEIFIKIVEFEIFDF